MNTKAIIIPGNGDDGPGDGWRPYVVHELSKLGIGIINLRFPDPELARQSYWIPFLETLAIDEETILIGHSSGAVAAIRYAAENRVRGTVLVSAYHTDLGLENEKISGYFDDEWQWEKVKSNQDWIIQFHSTDDPFIPTSEARFVRDRLDTEYHEFTDREHHNQTQFPELVEAIVRKVM
ncbi:MAG: alpha/beta fold hydrolase [Candidatus Paceibacterota bacterium]